MNKFDILTLRQSNVDKFFVPPRNQNVENNNFMEIKYKKEEDLPLAALKLNQIESFEKAKKDLLEEAKKLLEKMAISILVMMILNLLVQYIILNKLIR